MIGARVGPNRDVAPVANGGTAASGPLLECEDVAVSIAGTELLSNVSLRLERGQSLGIVGETGSGKSLACRTMIGLLGRLGGRLTRGRLAFDGIDLTSAPERQWRRLRGRRIALVPQASLSGLDPVMTVGHQLEETVRCLTGERDAGRRAHELLELVDMPAPAKVMRSYPHELSGGMRQRAMIALAVAGDPALLIADEPTTALDVTVQRVVLDLLVSLVRSRSMGLVLVSHDLGVVEEHTDLTAIMYAGQTVELGATEVVLRGDGHPYTRALLASRPTLHASGSRLGVIPGAPPSPDQWPSGCRFAPRCPHVRPGCEAVAPVLQPSRPERAVRCARIGEI